MKFSQVLLVSIATQFCSSASIGNNLFNGLFPVQQQLSKEEPTIWEKNEELIELHKNLVEIPSVSYDEAKIAEFLSTYFTDKGYTVEDYIIDETTGRKNLFIYSGKQRETRILLTSHVDTVPPFFPYSVDGDNIYGRGTVDDKASVATQIIAFEQLLESGEISEGDVALLLDVGEEKGGDGAKDAYKNLKIPWETVIFGEPTNFNLITGHKGGAGGVLKATGKTGHSSIPELGINAIDLLIDALVDLKQAEFPGNEILGKSTLNVGVIQGGVAANVIPGEASASLLLRVATGEVDEVDAIFKEILDKHPRVEWEEYVSHGPVFFDSDIPGYELAVMLGGTDAASLTGDFDKYLIGPGGLTLHAADEHITVQDLVKGVQLYKDIVLYKLKS